MSRFPPDPLNVLTYVERDEWRERDEEGYYQWVRRMVKVDSVFLLSKKKIPRHRYNKNPLIP
jgi:hypothetical protein